MSETPIGFLLSMPIGEDLEIKSSRQLDEDVGIDEVIEDVVYTIYWNGHPLPWCASTQLQAFSIAFGCQYGAQEMMRKLGNIPKKESN